MSLVCWFRHHEIWCGNTFSNIGFFFITHVHQTCCWWHTVYRSGKLYGNNNIKIRYVKRYAVIRRTTHVDKLCFRGKPCILTGYVGIVCWQVWKNYSEWVSEVDISGWRKLPEMICYKQSSKMSRILKFRNSLIKWATDNNS